MHCGPRPLRRTGIESQSGPRCVPMRTRVVQLCRLRPWVNWTSSSSTKVSALAIFAKNPSQGRKFGWWQAMTLPGMLVPQAADLVHGQVSIDGHLAARLIEVVGAGPGRYQRAHQVMNLTVRPAPVDEAVLRPPAPVIARRGPVLRFPRESLTTHQRTMELRD